MDDLPVPPGPGAPRGLLIPARELRESFSHSSGPGGQGVNTSDSRVQLSFSVAESEAFSPAQRARLLEVLGPRLVNGTLTLAAQEHRSQRRNRAAARARLAQILREALIPPPPAAPRSPPRALSDAGSRPRSSAPRSRPTASGRATERGKSDSRLSPFARLTQLRRRAVASQRPPAGRAGGSRRRATTVVA